MSMGDWKGTSADKASGEKGRGEKSGPHWGDPVDADAQRARLVRTIEGEIVPRLVLTRRVTKTSGAKIAGGCAMPDQTDVLELVRLLLLHELGVCAAYVETVRQRGATPDLICLELLAPAARELGRRWEEDECDFMQVTLALCRLHQLLRHLSAEFRCEHPVHELERRILLVSCPGDQHTFGVSLVAEFLQRAGWEVWQEYPSDKQTILASVKQNWFAIVGLSVGSEVKVSDVAEIISEVRAVSVNRSVGVLVGGPMLLAKPEILQLVGADGTAADGPQAVLRAEQFCTLQSATNG